MTMQRYDAPRLIRGTSSDAADFLNWLGTLPPGSASFIGTLTRSFLSLVALLLGALFDARPHYASKSASRI
jgi:hypothetical protein